ncbi:ribonuclease HII [Chitinasiproducens palmae]|uniref:ribonuclease HII n=1 Tax=Chitinasiproducens palmae TaxID=1770053 RepID=UPI001F2E532E
MTSASTSTAQARRQPPARRWTDPPDTLCCGVDEAGRGPLAGPVVAAAVILDPARPIAGLDDSKALTARRREALFDEIVANALAFSIAEATVAEIDTLNILHATMLAMQRAVAGLSMAPGLVRVDGNRCPTLPCASEAVIGGDACVPAISAASILAKVSRDRQLLALDAAFPVYGFGQHAGYGTAQHLAALDRHGPCIHHRRSFAPVRRALGEPCGPTGRGPRRVQTPLDPAWFETMHDVVPRDPFSGKLF